MVAVPLGVVAGLGEHSRPLVPAKAGTQFFGSGFPLTRE
jgi:hypothetical protein